MYDPDVVMPYGYPAGMGGSVFSSWLTPLVGVFSLFAPYLGVGALGNGIGPMANTIPFLIMGSLIEAGRRLYYWVSERWRLQFSMTAQFNEGDPSYEWIVQFLTQERVWRRSRDFRVSAASSQRKWGIKPGMDNIIEGNADYVPTYEKPQLFRWNGHWMEIQRNKVFYSSNPADGMPSSSPGAIYLTIYSRHISVMSSFVEETREQYLKVCRPNVIIHLADQPHYGPGLPWTTVKRKSRRSIESIVLPDGVIQDLLQDAQEFIGSEEWYIDAGIPFRRGYLLHGPPGTGKSSTIYALAGELGLEIYSLSLSSPYVDDAFLNRAVSSIPKHSIFLIEDIDCAFPSRDELEDQMAAMAGYPVPVTPANRRSAVTLSGLLNVIDGVGSEEGKLFFATTNYPDRLDPALMRPGRIDKKIDYSLATKTQASALFHRFFPPSRFPPRSASEKSKECHTPDIPQLAEDFGSGVPPDEFSTAELQGYLLGWKKEPIRASDRIEAWVEHERKERRERAERENERKLKFKEAREKYGPYGYSPFGPPPASFVPPTGPEAPRNGEDTKEKMVNGASDGSTPSSPMLGVNPIAS